MADASVKVLDKALSILSLFRTNSTLTVSEIESLTGYNRTTIFRIVQSFAAKGYLVQDPLTKKYRTSLQILELAGAVLRDLDIVGVCRPYLLNLREQTGESSYLGMLDGSDLVVVDWEQSSFDARIIVNVGKTIPAQCTGAGKAILSALDPKVRAETIAQLDFQKYTNRTITDPDELNRVLDESAARGFAVSRGEYNLDIVVVAAPIFDIHNRVVASCAVAALETRVPDETKIESLGRLTVDAARSISAELGASE